MYGLQAGSGLRNNWIQPVEMGGFGGILAMRECVVGSCAHAIAREQEVAAVVVRMEYQPTLGLSQVVPAQGFKMLLATEMRNLNKYLEVILSGWLKLSAIWPNDESVRMASRIPAWLTSTARRLLCIAPYTQTHFHIINNACILTLQCCREDYHVIGCAELWWQKLLCKC